MIGNNIVLFVCSTVFVLFIVEIGLRLMGTQPSKMNGFNKLRRY